jgi:hypothetical protein
VHGRPSSTRLPGHLASVREARLERAAEAGVEVQAMGSVPQRGQASG